MALTCVAMLVLMRATPAAREPPAEPSHVASEPAARQAAPEEHDSSDLDDDAAAPGSSDLDDGAPPDSLDLDDDAAPLPTVHDRHSEGQPPPVPDAPLGLVAPVLLGQPELQLPAGTVLPAEPVSVEILIHIDEQGRVSRVDLLRGAGPPFDEAVLVAATHMRFEPARYHGEPVAVEVPYRQSFAAPPPPPPPEEAGARLDCSIDGKVLEMGTRRALPFVQVVATAGERSFRTTTDASGGFSLSVPSGELLVEVISGAHKRFLVHERLAPDEQLRVRYLAERLSYDPYETVVVGKRERREMARTTLSKREIVQVPGTFGDPFRVVGTLPGVGQVMSLLAYPIVRGTSPGDTGFLLDGVRVPQLFHMLAGPAVVHPELIDRVDFYPGSFPVEYGGYIGGIVDGISRRARPDERVLDVTVDLTSAGLFARHPLPWGLSGTVSGRYGYPGLLLGLFSDGVSASYWDYQLRLDGGGPMDRFSAFVFGSFDQVGQKDPDTGERSVLMRSQFHRVDLTYQLVRGDTRLAAKLALGLDQALAADVDDGGESPFSEVDPRPGGPAPDASAAQPDGRTTVTTVEADPRLRLSQRLGEAAEIDVGFDGMARRWVSDFEQGQAVDLEIPKEMYSLGVFAALLWRPTADWVVIPGVRGDVYRSGGVTKQGVDPRLLCRFRAARLEAGDLWVKAGVGVYHQPPRFYVPIPGLDEVAFKVAEMLTSYQASLGVEAPLAFGFRADAQLYFQYMNPLYLDLNVNEAVDAAAGEGAADSFDPLVRRIGRSYGIELLVKQEGLGPLFGWLSYTLSWSDRRRDGQWVPFDFDRRHMLHMVGGVSLPRNWSVAARLQVQSGRPVIGAAGFNAARTAAFYRIDLRVDKRAVWREWMFDFYVDIINATLSAEEVDERTGGIRYAIPTVGIRVVI